MKLRALVVDGSRVMRSMVIQTLRKAGVADFEFTEAEDGADALSKFSPKKIDIVFADWNMPKMSGIDFVRKVRSNKKAAHIPIIMVTSEKSMGKVETALDEAGANEYICKPFTPEQLQRKLAPILEGMGEAPEQSGGFFRRLVG